MKKYNLVNNTLGWLIFAIAAATYLLTIEPTASFWDCPEFIAQGYKMEIGHPPGNPIFIIAANVASRFAGGDVMLVAKCVNAMSAIFSALTILLLFWTITHFVKKLVVTDGQEDQMTLSQYLAVMGSGICGALAYTWSDTFWFSAVEAEVYAFSSLCTALVVWLMLKWENRADEPDSDRWIILIAYVFGISLGVHLLNLLAIPALALIYYYRKTKHADTKGSLLTLLASCVIIVLILWGLEPGFLELAGYFDVFFVNTLGMSFNTGTYVYGLVLLSVIAWNVFELYSGKSEMRMRLSFVATIFLSGVLFIGDSLLIPILLTAALIYYLFGRSKVLPRRLMTNVSLCVGMLFVGFSSYAVVLIRSNANTPLDENSPNTPAALVSYLSREQYGKAPLLYGRTIYSEPVYQPNGTGGMTPVKTEGARLWSREVKANPGDPDRYRDLGYKTDMKYTPELNMIFPRIYDDTRRDQYISLLGDFQGQQVEATTQVDEAGNPVQTETMTKPTMVENLRYFFGYQLNYMYWRYFLWNFAGRQNDIQGFGDSDITHGNWLTGIPFIDNARLGDQSLLPDDLKNNRGHNVFFMLPLLLGFIGLLWQAFRGQKGIEQFWVVAFFFFMTGIAIVLYLNQPPSQPRERDYAYAGSFYAFAIWIGMGVAAIWQILTSMTQKKSKTAVTPKNGEVVTHTGGLAFATLATVVGIIVPVQMVSQTWDDHDRSGRTAARDFGRNYLASVDQNGIIFCNGDNDTFPLWYLQEVEGFRTDVRAVNLSYLATDWYISQMLRAAYNSAPLPMQANPTTYAFDRRQYGYFITPDTTIVPATKLVQQYYDDNTFINPQYGVPALNYSNVAIPIDPDQAVKAGVISESQKAQAADAIMLNLAASNGAGLTAAAMAQLDILSQSVAQGWKRPVYFAMTVPENLYLGLKPYMRNTGMAYQVTPIYNPAAAADDGSIPSNTDKMYRIVTTQFRWGGLDEHPDGSLYLDETVRRMVTTARMALIGLAQDLFTEGQADPAHRSDRYAKARHILQLMQQKMPEKACEYGIQQPMLMAQTYFEMAKNGGTTDDMAKGKALLDKEISRIAQYVRFYSSLTPAQAQGMSQTDRYIFQNYFPQLFVLYKQYLPGQVDQIVKQIRNTGVDTGNVEAYLQQLDHPQTQQDQPQPKAPDSSNSMPADTQAGLPGAMPSIVGKK